MMVTIGNPAIGSFQARRLDDYNQGIPERRSTSSGTIDGETVHQISTARESDRQVKIPLILTREKAVILEALHMAANSTTGSSLFHLLQDGEGVWLGYFQSLGDKRIPMAGLYRYNLTFHCTSRLN